MPELTTMELRTDGTGLAELWLDRPDRLNAISFEMIKDFHSVLDRLAGDVAERVLLIAGRGRAFCAGTDLDHDIAEWPEPGGEVQKRVRQQERLAEIIVRLREIPQPVVAAVHGPAVGGGMAIAAAADIRVADPSARFAAAFIRVGLSGGDLGISWTLPRLIGLSNAAELLYTGRFVEAEEAHRMGLVSRLTADGGHVEVAREIANQILQHAPLGVQLTKRSLQAAVDAPSLRAHIELENRTQVLCTTTGDFEEGIAAFKEKRPPDYSNQ